MRKYHKKLVLEMLESLQKANDSMRKLEKNNDQDSIVQLLMDSQGVIQQIASFLGGYSEIPDSIFTALDEYNKELFITSQDISANTIKTLEPKRKFLRKTIETDLVAEKIVMAFLPYNASMSDSLESIWLAASQDPNCEVYLMPIPFYGRDKNRNFTQLQDHSNFYLEGTVPVMDWSKVDLASLHPDAIFIHNPYDENNYVTSVHPDYYSDTLKQYTECLVYVPYFIVLQNPQEHFMLTTGVQRADMVFLETEISKKDYIDVYVKKGLCSLKQARDKFISCGSTKLDKVINTTPEDFTLPQDWQRCITASDGTKKKVVLYVTTVGTILTEGEKHLEKMKEVFAFFQQREDVVLWWRPHPLELETYQSMRPQLLRDYLATVKAYQQEGVGIYDTSDHLHRAVAYGDLYYGDLSSVLTLFVVTEKPVLLQQVEVLGMLQEEQNSYIFSDAWMEGFRANVQKKPLHPYWPGAIREQYYHWDTNTLGELQLGYDVLALFLDFIQNQSSSEKQQNFKELLGYRSKNREEHGLQMDGKSGERIFQSVKERIFSN